MRPLPAEDDVLAALVRSGERSAAIRALVLTSSRARGDETVDVLSDYDVIVAVPDVDAFVGDGAWTRAYGEPLAAWGDRHEQLGFATLFRGVVYRDHVKIDYSLWPTALLSRIGETQELVDDLDVGYRVLLDKDGLTSSWVVPTFRAHVPEPPSHSEYLELVEEFWWTVTYVAKSIWRGELFFTKFVLDYDAKHVALRRMLEWWVETKHAWALRPGAYGRGLERRLPADIVDELAATYAALGVEENWEALFRTTVLFRRVAREVGDALGYSYPQDTDDGVTAFLERVRRLPR